MDKKQFVEMVGNPAKFSSQDRGWLRAVQARYPHSSVISVLALLADHAYGFDTPEQRRAAMLAMCDSTKIDAMLGKAVNMTEMPRTTYSTRLTPFRRSPSRPPRTA